MKKLFFLMLVFFSVNAKADSIWTFGSDVKIVSITQWESSKIHPLYFKRSDGVWCYVPVSENALNPLILMLYASGRLADIHCHKTGENKMVGMPPAHKTHRIIAK